MLSSDLLMYLALVCFFSEADARRLAKKAGRKALASLRQKYADSIMNAFVPWRLSDSKVGLI